MHTVKFAEEQGRRLAVYYSKVMDMKSGNREIVENKTGKPLADIRGLEEFLKEVKNKKIECYEQMSFVT